VDDEAELAMEMFDGTAPWVLYSVKTYSTSKKSNTIRACIQAQMIRDRRPLPSHKYSSAGGAAFIALKRDARKCLIKIRLSGRNGGQR
jgi:hypothetical protein